MGAPHRPIGYERETKGYILVKVSEAPRYDKSVPEGDHAGWKLKHVHVWEQANGREVPKGWTVLFLDGDKRYFDPCNPEAIPRKYMARLNSLRADGVTFHDRESLHACLGIVDAGMRIEEIEAAAPRVCGVCGREFVPESRWSYQLKDMKTCRDCLDRGMKSRGDRCAGMLTTCDKCGVTFQPVSKRQHTCSDCQPECVKRRRKRSR